MPDPLFPAWRLRRRESLTTLVALTAAARAGAAPPAPDHTISPSAPEPLPSPQGKVVLSISGDIGRVNQSTGADFDLDMLAALPQHRLVTRTPWHPGELVFTGPLLRVVLNLVGARGTRLIAVALNDYRCEIPTHDAVQYDVVLARMANGEAMRVRDKGPLFIVYPYDSDSRLRSERYYARSIWQLRSLHVQP